jgi:hypothetical protein
MSHRNPTARKSLPPRLSDWLRTAGERIFSDSDAQAREHGWRIIPLYGGLGRMYRDPRFDSLIRCPRCYGTGSVGGGVSGAGPCLHCGGAGRIVTLEVEPDVAVERDGQPLAQGWSR